MPSSGVAVMMFVSTVTLLCLARCAHNVRVEIIVLISAFGLLLCEDAKPVEPEFCCGLHRSLVILKKRARL